MTSLNENDDKIRLEILEALYKFYTEVTVNDGINVDYIAKKYEMDKNYFWNKHILYLEGAKHIKIIDSIGRKVAIDKNGISFIKPNDKFYKNQNNISKQEINVNNFQIVNSFINNIIGNNNQINTFTEKLIINIENSSLTKTEKETWLNKIKDGGLNSIIPIILETIKQYLVKT